MKEVSSGFLLKCPSGFLLVHPTLMKFDKGCWDIPKGHIEGNETPIETALREFKEETGMDFPKIEYEYLGFFNYNKRKNIHLFYAELLDDIDINNLNCKFTFEYKGKTFYENNGYKLSFDIDDFLPNLQKILRLLDKTKELN